jgi:hypothetical protein
MLGSIQQGFRQTEKIALSSTDPETLCSERAGKVKFISEESR